MYRKDESAFWVTRSEQAIAVASGPSHKESVADFGKKLERLPLEIRKMSGVLGVATERVSCREPNLSTSPKTQKFPSTATELADCLGVDVEPSHAWKFEALNKLIEETEELGLYDELPSHHIPDGDFED